MKIDAAELLAIRALGWLAGQEELWPGFLNATGVQAAGLRAAAGQPDFLRAVLEYLTQSDGWVTAFCEAEGFGYTEPMAALQALGGGQDPHWT